MKMITVKPTGNSMKPFIYPGDTVYLKLDCKDIRKYDVVLYQAYGVSVLHRVIGEEKSKFVICGDNTAVLEKIPKKMIAAKAVKIVRGGKEIDLNNPIIKIQVFLWYQLGIKRLARFVKRKLNNIK